MSGTANQEFLEALHKKLAEAFTKALEDPEIKPATLTAVAKFLKDNNVVMIPDNQDALDAAAEKYKEMAESLEDDNKHLPFPKQA